MKLYTVGVTFEYVIAVDNTNGEGAITVASDVFRDVSRELEMHNVDWWVEPMVDIPDGWDAQCLPYNGDGVRRIADYIKESK